MEIGDAATLQLHDLTGFEGRCDAVLFSRDLEFLPPDGGEALGAVRVMRTCGMMGEIVGMAASLCKKHDCQPRAVYESHLAELIELMKRGAGKKTTRVVARD